MWMVAQKILVKPHLPQRIPPVPDPMQGTNQPAPDPRWILASGQPQAQERARVRPLWGQARARGQPLSGPTVTCQQGIRPLPHLRWRPNQSEEAWREAIQRGQWAPPWQRGRPQARASPGPRANQPGIMRRQQQQAERVDLPGIACCQPDQLRIPRLFCLFPHT